jgi:hypothetical protein
LKATARRSLFSDGRAWARVGRSTNRLTAQEIRERHLEGIDIGGLQTLSAGVERLLEKDRIKSRLTSQLGRLPKILGQAMFQQHVEGLSAPDEHESFSVGALETARDLARLEEQQEILQDLPLRSAIEHGPPRSPYPSRVHEVAEAIAKGLVYELDYPEGSRLMLTEKGRALLDAMRLEALLRGE